MNNKTYYENYLQRVEDSIKRWEDYLGEATSEYCQECYRQKIEALFCKRESILLKLDRK